MLAVACFFFNHSEATRVMWTPPLRESFAFPLCIAQMWLVTKTLKRRELPAWLAALMTSTTCLFIVIWQFAQFSLLTQLCVVYGIYVVGLVSYDVFKNFLIGLTVSKCKRLHTCAPKCINVNGRLAWPERRC